jgi:hypothetical protein
MTLLSYAYTNKMTFAPLQTSTHEKGPVTGTEVQQQRCCSPRSMYSLAAAVSTFYGTSPLVLTCWKLGINKIKEDALQDIRSKLSASNIAQELFTPFAAG